MTPRCAVCRDTGVYLSRWVDGEGEVQHDVLACVWCPAGDLRGAA